MMFLLRDRFTGLFVSHDLMRGYHFTRNLKRACRFSGLVTARETVLLVCNGEKEINRKARLEAIRESQLRSVDKRRYFQQTRTKG